MGVKEELEALRNSGVTKKNASKLKDASGLSTPETEQNAMKAEQERTRIGNYGKEADSNLKSYNEAKVAVQPAASSPSKASKTTAKATPAAAQTDSSSKTAPVAATVNDDDDDDDDDVPALEELPDMEAIPSMEASGVAAASAAGAVAAPTAGTINRAERKARRMMEKLGMKKVTDISQVVLKMQGGARGGVFTIVAPDVFEKNGSYVVFGEARQGGGARPGAAAGSAQAQQAAAIQQLAALAKSGGGLGGAGGIEMPNVVSDVAAAGNDSVKIEEVGSDEAAAVDDSGLEDKDISLVVTQAGCSRSKAVQALKDNDGDLVNAIMSLTA